MALPSAVFGFLLLLSGSVCVHSFNLIDSLTIKALMRGRHQQQMREAEILDATKGDIINALVTKLTNLMNEQRLNELAKLPMGSVEAMEAMEAEQVWPIFAQGGDYGPKYDMLEANGDLDIDENDFEKRSAAEIFVDSLTKKDLESLLHQPDPSLTVQELPQNPKISFRKGSHILDKETIASEESTEAPLFQGMKEVIRESRSGSNLIRSPPIQLSKQLRSLKQIN